MYLKMDESLSGGNAPIYYANTLIKFISSDKKNKEDDGFDGFVVKTELLKSRTNKAGRPPIKMVYNQSTGFDPVLTLYQFADDNNLVEGRNPYRYFKNHNDIKFDSRKFREAFMSDEKLRTTLMNVTEPYLMDLLSRVDDAEREMSHMDVLRNILDSQDNE